MDDVEVGATDAVEGPRIALGVTSGLSIQRSGVRTRRDRRRCSPPTEYDSLGFQWFSF